jgi:hypothetical protein
MKDDVDWDIDFKTQLHLLSNALAEFRRGSDNITNTHPYGTDWDYFSFGHCLEVHICFFQY